jgi:hypothetical protein
MPSTEYKPEEKKKYFVFETHSIAAPEIRIKHFERGSKQMSNNT